jgi:hypothetical protein
VCYTWTDCNTTAKPHSCSDPYIINNTDTHTHTPNPKSQPNCPPFASPHFRFVLPFITWPFPPRLPVFAAEILLYCIICQLRPSSCQLANTSSLSTSRRRNSLVALPDSPSHQVICQLQTRYRCFQLHYRVSQLSISLRFYRKSSESARHRIPVQSHHSAYPRVFFLSTANPLSRVSRETFRSTFHRKWLLWHPLLAISRSPLAKTA